MQRDSGLQFCSVSIRPEAGFIVTRKDTFCQHRRSKLRSAPTLVWHSQTHCGYCDKFSQSIQAHSAREFRVVPQNY